jgi:hypothetical protein
MLASSRNARRLVRQRSNATRFNASLKRGRAIATHLVAAGFDDATVKGLSAALKKVARDTGMQPAKISRTRNTVDGKGGRKAKLRKVHHYTPAQLQTLLSAYKPRKASYKAAKLALAA